MGWSLGLDAPYSAQRLKTLSDVESAKETWEMMAEILHQLSLVFFPTIYDILYIPGGCLDFFHQ